MTANSVITSVLVVDDSAAQRSYAARLCRELGVAIVHQASNGQEALALLDGLRPKPGLLIVDLEMPTMDGAELLEHLGRRSVDIPIIVASSRERVLLDSVLDMGGVVGLHVVRALQKPLQLEALRVALQYLSSGAIHAKLPGRALPIDADELSAGMERREITVHYQPKVDIRSGEVCGVEALARWQHPTWGAVPPDQFIPLAEKSDLIHRLTMDVMNQALSEIGMLNADGLDLSVAINMSPMLLNRSELLQEISSVQQSHDFPTDHIVLEVTETSLVREMGVALGVLTRLRLRGFGLSLDDYGTGFSSMQQLTRIPFTELKIDRSFVHGAHQRANMQAILRSALDLAGKLGLTTVAEGIECLEDWRLLQEFGCTYGQGWLIAKAMPADLFVPWLEGYVAQQGQLCAAGPGSKRAAAGPATL